MKQWLMGSLLALFALLTLSGCGGKGDSLPGVTSEFEGVWEATIDSDATRAGRLRDVITFGIGQTGTLSGAIKRTNLTTGKVSRGVVTGAVDRQGQFQSVVTGDGELGSFNWDGTMAKTSPNSMSMTTTPGTGITTSSPIEMKRVE